MVVSPYKTINHNLYSLKRTEENASKMNVLTNSVALAHHNFMANVAKLIDVRFMIAKMADNVLLML